MNKIALGIIGVFFIATPALADNIADCEIVIQKEIVMDVNIDTNAEAGTEIGEDKTAQIATYLPASDFIFSVFDTEPGHIETIDDNKIRALMCTRSSVLPTEFDQKLIETGVPFFLSRDFDAVDSAFMAIQQKDGIFKYDYSGPDLNEADIETLRIQLKSIGGIAEHVVVAEIENEKPTEAKKTSIKVDTATVDIITDDLPKDEPNNGAK